MTAYWPAWIVAPALGALTVSYWIALRRPLSVSGVLARFSRVEEELEFDRGSAVVQSDLVALEAAMAAATAEAFGDMPPPDVAPAAPGPSFGADMPPTPSASPSAAPAAATGRICAPTPTLGAHATFLAALAAGGLLASMLRGDFGSGLGDSFARHFGSGPRGLVLLAAGGVLVGFGTALSGGCSAGHGLTGCGRLMPGSLVATAVFFAAAVGVSFLLAGVA